MRTIDDINSDFYKLWGKYVKPESDVFLPLQYKTPKEGSIVFVGMNPSFSDTGWKFILKQIERPDLDVKEFFKWPKSKIYDVDLDHKLELAARNHYPFFAHHRKLANLLKKDWEHLDLFAYRQTNQNNFKTLIFEDLKKLQLNKFGISQFDLFFEILSLAKPSAIIITNALASNIYKKQRSLTFNDAVGYYEECFDDKTKIPVFFSGMLTGGRALDVFSRERLFWQIKKASS